MLLHHLYMIEFYSLIPNDDNRGEDGKDLRDKFVEKEGLQALSFCPQGPCKVLEMLIGLSFRLEFETAQSRWEKTPKEWFWILIDNLDLSWCTNSEFMKYDRISEIDEKISILLDRKYKNDGYGGLFPLKNPKKDQKEVEIWYQMSAYILENYPI
jgi:hypothetical protein